MSFISLRVMLAAGALAATLPLRLVAQATPPTFDLVAMDYALRIPPTAAAGLTRIVLRNTGQKLHHAQLLRLEQGKRLGDLYPLITKQRGIGTLPAWAVPAGGPSAALPGQTIAVTQTLGVGRYAVICWVPAPDGAPHFMKGMAGEFEVTGTATTVAKPATSTGVALGRLPITLSKPLSKGRQQVSVTNTGTTPHEFLLVRLAPGKTVDDVATWSEKGQVTTPAPALAWHGIAAMAPGQTVSLDLDLPPGTYAIFCLSPHVTDGRPHLLHGERLEVVLR